jgi:hypothetical protein
LICGRYEGVDERVAEALATDEISIGDYVLSGGEPAATVLVDAVTRLVPGALGSETSAVNESFPKGCWTFRIIRARRSSKACLCRKFFGRASWRDCTLAQRGRARKNEAQSS